MAAAATPAGETSGARAFRTAFDVPWNTTITQLRSQQCPIGFNKRHLSKDTRDLLRCASASGHVHITGDNALCYNANSCEYLDPKATDDTPVSKTRYIKLINQNLPLLNAAMVWARRNWILEHLAVPVAKRRDVPTEAMPKAPWVLRFDGLRSNRTEELLALVNDKGYWDQARFSVVKEFFFMPILARRPDKPAQLTRRSSLLLMAMINAFDAVQPKDATQSLYWSYFTSANSAAATPGKNYTQAERQQVETLFNDIDAMLSNFSATDPGAAGTLAADAVQKALDAEQKSSIQAPPSGKTPAELVEEALQQYQQSPDTDPQDQIDYYRDTIIVQAKGAADAALRQYDTKLNAQQAAAAAAAATPAAATYYTTEDYGVYGRVLDLLHVLEAAGGQAGLAGETVFQTAALINKMMLLARRSTQYIQYPEEDPMAVVAAAAQKAFAQQAGTTLFAAEDAAFAAFMGALEAQVRNRLKISADEASASINEVPIQRLRELTGRKTSEMPQLSSSYDLYKIEYRDLDLRVAVVTGLELIFVNGTIQETRFAVVPTRLFAWDDQMEKVSTAVQRQVHRLAQKKFIERITDLQGALPEFMQQLKQPFKDGGVLGAGMRPEDLTSEELIDNVVQQIFKCVEFGRAHPTVRSDADIKATKERLQIGDSDIAAEDACTVRKVGSETHLVPRSMDEYLFQPRGPLEKSRVDDANEPMVPIFRDIMGKAHEITKQRAKRRDQVLG
jgi:hypothetical protein